MDVLSPTLIWIDKRCYRVNQTMDTNASSRVFNEPQGYKEEDLYGEECEEDNTDEYIIEMTEDHRFKTEFHVPNLFYGSIIGTKGSTKKRIEVETKTQIKVPALGDRETNITILSIKRENVILARKRIETIADCCRKKQNFTHFIGIPLNKPNIQESFNKFKTEILNGPSVYGLDSNMFQLASKIHLTIGMLSLMDKIDRENCIKLLKDCEENIVKPAIAKCNTIKMHVKNLNIMNDDPSSVNILYAELQSEPLQQIAEEITDYFVSKGYICRKNKMIKFHVTLINTRYKEDNEENNHNDYRQRQKIKRVTFDARDILAKYKEYDFGIIDLTEIHLSQLHTAVEEKYYDATAIINI